MTVPAAGHAAEDELQLLRRFGFPLDVYAAVLHWSEGCVEDLHYGLFEHLDEPIRDAQQRATAKLWAQMPAAPCRLLEVGIGLGHTLKRLREDGYDAFGITPDPAQAALAAQRHGSGLDLRICRLEDMAPGDPPFDAMVLQESAQYIEPLALFEAADRLLAVERAELLVMDEFALARHSDADTGLHLLPHFLALAGRFGWLLVHAEDVSAQARITVDVLLRLTTVHRDRLRSDLGLSDEALRALDGSNRQYADRYRRGVYGYRVLRFKRGPRPAAVPIGLTEIAAPAMRGLFKTVFGREMGAAEWHWKYGAGRGRGVGMASSSSPCGDWVAFYGGLRRPLALFGAPAIGCQVCDVMVAADGRGSLVRQGAMQRAAASFLETEIGWGLRHAVGFGFPNRRAHGVAERLQLYEAVDSIVAVSWTARPPRRGGIGHWFGSWGAGSSPIGSKGALTRPGRERAVVERLWSRMAAGLIDCVLGVRDAAWLQWRYVEHPLMTYRVGLVRSRWLGRPLGLTVTRERADALDLIDLVGPPRHFAALVDSARMDAGVAAKARLCLWITRSQLHRVESIDRAAMRLDDPRITVPANRHTPGLAPALLRDRWFLTAGDADFT